MRAGRSIDRPIDGRGDPS